MPEPLLAVLKLLVLALLYLFFLRVLRAVWSEVHPPRPAAPRRARRRERSERRAKVAHLTVVEPTEQKGRTYDLGDEVTVGRAAGCQVTLEDTYVSQLHARVYARDGAWFVEDLGSTNGTYLNSRRVTGATPMQRGDRLKIGATVLEVRT